MNDPEKAPNQAQDEDRPEGEDSPEAVEAVWTPPEQSDQAPGEEAVQVNDAYRGGGPPPADESHQDDEQHPTGG